jgi:hypothetical protein
MDSGGGTFWPTGLALAVTASASIAAAQSSAGPQLQVIAPEGCPGEEAIRSDIEALLGRAWHDLDPSTRVQIEISARGAGAEAPWSLRLRTDAGAERLLHGESCPALVQAAALVVAWTIDPAADLAAADPAATGPATSHLGPSAADAPRIELGQPALPAARSEGTFALGQAPATGTGRSRRGAAALADPARNSSARSARSVGIGGGFMLDFGTLPEPAPGLAAEVVIRNPAIDLRVRGGWLSTQRAALENRSGVPAGAAVEVAWAGGSLLACGRPLDGSGPSLALCGGVQGGALLARGVGISSPGAAAAPLPALTVGAVLPWAPVPEFDAEIAVEIGVPLGAPTFEIEPFGRAYTPSPLTGRIAIAGHVDVR